MSISLTPDQERFIQTKLQAGKYRSAEEALEIALRLLDEYDRADAEWIEAVRDAARWRFVCFHINPLQPYGKIY